jgi:NDP-sugar pyrophosphorylase family protein
MAPVLGETLLEYWLSHFACAKLKQVVIAAHDRPDLIRNLVGTGSRWGIEVEVTSESQDLTHEQVCQKYEGHAVIVDHLPGLPEQQIFAGYDTWYRALLTWMPRANTPDRVGLRELADGVWAGLHTRISPTARLDAPCWLGNNVYVGDRAIIGPGTILENGAFIEPEAVISNSVVGPDTFVGRYMRIANSIAWGDILVDWQTGSETIEQNAFLLCSLHPRHIAVKHVPLMERIAEWLGRWDSDVTLKDDTLLSNEVQTFKEIS